ncbi:haloacid dehalogenase-like hydrolase [Prevotella sp. E2-28]|uniref:haloacid dehalogenase-like hydrolase n=1 Tax=Prevotella sp. E2-28 TaxID=2913620 RepID=UPI001EDBB4F2|nr:haloacid dehalogenase-like hydrolase [Prevotella sp. E2-28]UKK53246.1 haloacid dehalogenase-like hydrolase [Prevotella sp. E2-28]
MKKHLSLLVAIVLVTMFTACSSDDGESSAKKEYFQSWNKCTALDSLQAYVEDVTNPQSPNYISPEDRIATFDMDGTFVGELYPTYFEYNMLEYRVFDDATYKDKAPEDVKEAAQAIRDFVRKGTALPKTFELIHARAAAKAYSGMTIAEFDAYVKAYCKLPANGFKNMTYGQSFYKPMLEVFDYLKDNGFTYYVVSGSDRFLCRALVEPIGIAPNRVIGMDVCLMANNQNKTGLDYTMGKEEYLVRTDSLILKNLKTIKVLQISQEIGKMPVLSFGNSSGDCAMHNYCLSNKQHRTAAFMLVADDADRDHADLKEAESREAKWREAGYHIISMKNDFKTIYGYDVQKVDFTFPAE